MSDKSPIRLGTSHEPSGHQTRQNSPPHPPPEVLTLLRLQFTIGPRTMPRKLHSPAMTIKNFAAHFCLLAAALTPAISQQPKYPFNDPSLPTEKRIDNLLSLMTTEEKVSILGTQTGVPRLGVPNIGSSEGIHGVVQREPRGKRLPIRCV